MGGDKFKGSNFIHPLKTPSGFTGTDFQPVDHLHHFGLWWPWKKIKVDGREIITWELQKGEGLNQGRKAVPTKTGIVAESDYLDRTAPDGPLGVLHETTQIGIENFKTTLADGYFLDFDIEHRCSTELPVEVSKYRYSDFQSVLPRIGARITAPFLPAKGRGALKPILPGRFG